MVLVSNQYSAGILSGIQNQSCVPFPHAVLPINRDAIFICASCEKANGRQSAEESSLRFLKAEPKLGSSFVGNFVRREGVAIK